jgi:hypothetical protein
MKDQVIALIEAVRLARLELECYRDPQFRGTADWTLNRLDELLNGHILSEAMASLSPETDGPPLVPGNDTSSSRIPHKVR